MGTAIAQHKPRENRFVEYCDFCGSSASEAGLLIKSYNGAHICDDCVRVCLEVVADHDAQEGE